MQTTHKESHRSNTEEHHVSDTLTGRWLSEDYGDNAY